MTYILECRKTEEGVKNCLSSENEANVVKCLKCESGFFLTQQGNCEKCD